MQFNAVCSKWNKRLTLSLSAVSLEEARAILHSQGYSIIELHTSETNENKESDESNFFYFDIYINGELKTGKIQSDDIFKSYKKLIEDLGYNVAAIYTHEWMSDDQKKVITAKVKDTYSMYRASQWEVIVEKKQTEKEKELKDISPQMLKEIEFYSKTIDSILLKIEETFTKYGQIVTPTKRSDLERFQQVLQQSKGSSNLWKLKLILEDTLKLIWEIELEALKNGMIEEKKKFLDGTNALLKQIWSNERVKEQGKDDINVSKALSWLLGKISPQKEEKKVDSHSFIYYKNQRELNLYKENLNKTDIQILKAVFTFKFSFAKKLLLKKKLLLQNIQIIDNRIHNKTISYTKIIHGFHYYTSSVVAWIEQISNISLYTLLLYSYIFILFTTLNATGIVHSDIQPKTFLFITIFSYITLIFSFVRNIWFFVLSVPLMIFVFLFFSINF